MTFISQSSTSLLSLLQRSQIASPGPSRDTDIVAIMNGTRNVHEDGQPAASSSLFDRQALDVNEMKVNLIDRLGKALGVSRDDYDNQSSFGTALKAAIAKLRRDPGGATIIAAIEKRLGLDKLGISMDTLLNAVIDPGSEDARRLDGALRAQAGEMARDEAFELDEIGIYRPGR